MSSKVLLLCGGNSDEHEVSLASARSVLRAARELSITPRVIGRNGRLLSPCDSLALLNGEGAAAPQEGLRGGTSPAEPLGAPPASALTSLAAAAEGADVIFPLLHGPYGEDGRLQGVLDLLGVPYVGSGVLGSAAAMDKLVMKAVLAAHGLPQVRYAAVTRREWREERGAALRRAAQLNYPLFVKPANLGSSIGISRATDPAQLEAALGVALEFDHRAILEEAVVGARELEVGLLGNEQPAASPVGEVRYRGEFYDYNAKYTDGAAELLAPAELPAAVTSEVQEFARRAFTALDCAGLARVDFFYVEATGELYLNELNTMPGFTRHSMYPLLWRAAGVGYAELIARLIGLAFERHG